MMLECFAASSEKPCQIEINPNHRLQGTLKRLNLTEFNLENNGKISTIKYQNILSMTIRFQTRKLKTDKDISKNTSSLRKLEKWNTEGPEISLEKEDRNWNQFETNKRIFGVVSTYDEELYTTKKVPVNQLSKEQIKRAMKIEKELTNSSRKDFENDEEEDEEKMFGAVIGTGRYIEAKPAEVLVKRERATSMGSYCEFTKDEYKKKREKLINPHKYKDSTENIDFLESLDLNIVNPINEEVLASFIKFKQERQPSRESVVKDFKEFSNRMNKITSKLEVIQEEASNTLPNSIIDLFFKVWRTIK